MDRKDRYFELITKNPTAWLGHGEFAIKLVETFKPSIILDLGVDFGYSTFCWAYPKIGKVYGVDMFKGEQHPEGRDAYNIFSSVKNELEKEFSVNNIEIIVDDFVNLHKRWTDTIDILHIDGDHSYEAVSRDFHMFSKFVSDDGIILFHDTISYKDTVGKFFQELDGYKVNKMDWYGLGIYTKSSDTFKKITNILNINI
jgi:predicted O-methyltransferase YrrM